MTETLVNYIKYVHTVSESISRKVDYSVRNEKITSRALQGIGGGRTVEEMSLWPFLEHSVTEPT